MSKQIFEEKGGPHLGHAAGATDAEKQASQLASDVKYKVKQQLNKGTKMNPAQVAKAYLAQLAKSPAPPAVKALAKKKILGEEYTSDILNLVEDNIVAAMVKVFVEGIDTKKNNKDGEDLQEEEEKNGDKKYKIRVTDKKTGNTYVRMATRAKIAELRANPNISSVEMTQYGEVSSDEKSSGKQTAAVKAGKDYDGDGEEESPAKEYRGVVHNAIQRRTGGKPDGKDTSSVKEQFLADGVKDTNSEKKIDVMKGKNNVIINPPLGESSVIEKTMTDSEKEEENKLKDKYDKSGMKASMKKQYGEKKGPEVYFALLRKKAMQNASYQPEGDSIAESECCDCGKSPCGCDSRKMPTEASLVKNELRARGIKVSGETPSPRNMETANKIGEQVTTQTQFKPLPSSGSIGTNKPPAAPTLPPPSANKSKPKPQPHKPNPMGYAIRGNTFRVESSQINGEVIGDVELDEARRGPAAPGKAEKGAAAAASLAAKRERQKVLDKHEKKTGNKLDIEKTPEGKSHAKNFPGSRQAPTVKGAKETPAETHRRRVNRQVARVMKHGHTSRERREAEAMSKHTSSRD